MQIFWWFFGTFMILGYLYTWWRTAGVIAWDGTYGSRPDGDSIAFGYAMGFLIALIWPLALPFLILKENNSVGGNLLYVPKEHRRALARQREQEAQTRIRQLEREVGVDS